MDSTGKIAKKIISNADIVFLVYAIKRLNKIPAKYNKMIYAFFLSPMMLMCATRWTDAIASGYRNFLIKFCYPELTQSYTGHTYDGCETHRKLTNLPPDASCIELCKTYIPVTLRKTFSLYFRFYLVQMVIVSIFRRKFSQHQIQQTLVSMIRSSLFLAGQCIAMRLELCFATHMGVKLNAIKVYLMCFLCSSCIWLERSDRVGQINNLVFAHVLIGFLRKKRVLHPLLTLPAFFGVIRKEMKVDPITLIIAMASTLTF